MKLGIDMNLLENGQQVSKANWIRGDDKTTDYLANCDF